MGAAVSAAKRQLTRPIKTYNVEERAMKAIAKDKPTPAPPHPSMKKVMEEIMKDPSKLQSSRSDPKLLQNLSQVYITSQGVNPTIKAKRLPIEREPPDEFEFGYGQPKQVPPGKASLKQILAIIAKHSKEPNTHSAENIAKDYNLDIVDVRNILQHTRMLLIYEPPPQEKKPTERNPLRRLQNSIDNLKR